MNVELLREVADYIEAHPDEFAMDAWAQRTACGTACCVAGTVYALRVRPFEAADFVASCLRYHRGNAVAVDARRLLDLSPVDADTLFTSGWWWGGTLRRLGFRRDIDDRGHIPLFRITPRHAVKVLRALADGRVSL